jgi:plasmid stabilization system protein ParE
VAAGYWQVQLSGLAKQDYRDILRWSAEKFGAAQAKNYANQA